MNEITVYWSCLENEWMRAEEPVPVSNLFYKDLKYNSADPNVNMHVCPAFNKVFYNMFGLKSIYDYEFTVKNNTLTSDFYDQQFFERHINIKSIPKKLFAFQQSFIFFTEDRSLETTLSLPPYLEDNNIMERCTVLPGITDIGQWFRNTDLSFFLKKDFDTFKITDGEIYSYIQFHTDKKIKFKQFKQTEKLNGFLLDCIRAKNNKRTVFSMDKYFGLFKSKKLILKEIKDNLID